MLGGGILYMTYMSGKSCSGILPPLTAEQERLAGHLRKHIAVLSEEIGECNLWRDGTLNATADYIEETFQAMGYAVTSQAYTAQGISVRNLETVLGGTLPTEEIILIGAHYDTARGDNITAMLSLETIGYYSDAKGSQQYPSPVYAWLYPNTGNFIDFVGNLASCKLVRQCLGSFRRHSAFPSEGVAAPGRMMGIHWSDHWSFWQEGYAAVMVTDTALFCYPHYHASTDLPDSIDYERLARVVEGLAKVTVDLAQQQ
jgi:hypothetical protein